MDWFKKKLGRQRPEEDRRTPEQRRGSFTVLPGGKEGGLMKAEDFRKLYLSELKKRDILLDVRHEIEYTTKHILKHYEIAFDKGLFERGQENRCALDFLQEDAKISSQTFGKYLENPQTASTDDLLVSYLYCLSRLRTLSGHQLNLMKSLRSKYPRAEFPFWWTDCENELASLLKALEHDSITQYFQSTRDKVREVGEYLIELEKDVSSQRR